MIAILQVVVPFVLASAVILFSGVRLARYGDVIATRTGLGGTWMGLVVMAAVTSLPELITGASAIVIVDVPEVAAGDAIGSCMFNLLILALLDFRHPGPLSASMHQGHVLAAGFGLVQLGLAALAVAAGPHAPAVGWVALHSLIFLLVYGFATQLIFSYERRRLLDLASEIGGGEARAGEMTLRAAITRYVAVATLLVAAAAYLPASAEQLAALTGMGQGFVGSLFVAAATSLPEIVVSIAAFRMGAIDMAAANLFGSNIFNIAVLGVDDLLYTRGALLAGISPVHLVSLLAALVMTAITVIGLTYRAQRKRFRLSWDSIAIVSVYVIGITLLWRMQ
jgi:cation:H+ antiporter